jgi:sortase A
MTLSRKVAVSLIAAGSVLFGMYLVPTIYGAAMAKLEISNFRSHKSQTVLWDRARTRAYRRTLHVAFPAAEAVLSIPRLGVEVPVLEGTSDLTLNRGVGHIAGTALPGEPGNVAITGHRDGFFRPLKDIQPGDVIEVQREDATDHYIVRGMKIVSPSDTSVLNPTAGNTLTLVTCYPFYFVGSAPQRYIVQASLMPAEPLAQSFVTSVSPASKPSGD